MKNKQKIPEFIFRIVKVFASQVSLMVVFAAIAYGGLKTQNVAITGIVTASTGEALPGVNVLIKGTLIGTSTDANGKYTISVPDEELDGVLIFSFIGYASQEVSIANRTSIDVVLEDDIQTLGEVVVVGYGTQKKADVTGSVVSVSSKQLESIPVLNTEQVLQGRAAGVVVTTNGGAPGGSATVQIRGVGTIGSTEPIYVIDGVVTRPGASNQFSTSPLASINPGDIESMTVLKDASAAAIYGASAGNGVVIITTKRGKTGEPRVSFDAYYGVQQVSKKLDMMNSQQYLQYMTDRLGDANVPANTKAQLYNTDWQDEFFRTAPIQNYNMSISGGTEKMNYSVSGNLFDQQGIVPGTDFKRKSVRINTDFDVSSRLRVGESFTYSNTVRSLEAFTDSRRLIEHLLKMPSTIAIYNANNIGGYNGPVESADGVNTLNPIGIANLYTNRPTSGRILGNVYAELDLIKGLTFKTMYSIDFNNTKNFQYNPSFQMTNGQLTDSRYSKGFSENNNQQWTNTLTYAKQMGEHQLTAMAGYEAWWSRDESVTGSVTKLLNNTIISLNGSQTTPTVSDRVSERALESVLGRLNYAYKDKYLVTVSARMDASSKLNPEDRAQWFPSFSLGWNISNEAFMENVTFLSELKLRGGYGEIGNVGVLGDYNTTSLNTAANYNFNGQLAQGTAPTLNRNPKKRWETTEMTNFAVDGAILDNSLFFTIEYYIRNTDGLLAITPYNGPSTGLGGDFINIGKIENKGWDFMAGYRGNKGELRYEISANASLLNNKLTKLYDQDKGNFTRGDTRTAVGDALGSFYGYVMEGIFQTQAEIDAAPEQPNAQPGDIRFRDISGPDKKPDGIIDANDRTNIGSPIPQVTYGLNISLMYSSFDLSLFAQGVGGNKVYNGLRTFTESLTSSFNQSTDVLDHWTPTNPSTEIPRASSNDPNNNTRFSTRWLENGSFMRMKNVTLGYTLKEPISQKLSMSRVRVYATAQNLFTITKYKGYDPELGSADGGYANYRGVDTGNFPQPRTFIVGVQATF